MDGSPSTERPNMDSTHNTSTSYSNSDTELISVEGEPIAVNLALAIDCGLTVVNGITVIPYSLTAIYMFSSKSGKLDTETEWRHAIDSCETALGEEISHTDTNQFVELSGSYKPEFATDLTSKRPQSPPCWESNLSFLTPNTETHHLLSHNDNDNVNNQQANLHRSPGVSGPCTVPRAALPRSKNLASKSSTLASSKEIGTKLKVCKRKRRIKKP